METKPWLLILYKKDSLHRNRLQMWLTGFLIAKLLKKFWI